MTTASSSGATAGFRRSAAPALGDVLERDRHRAVAVERHAAGEQLVEDDADRVEVGALADRVALRLLGREVLRGAHDRPGLRHVRRAGAGDAEVGDLRAALVVDDDVVRLEVAVDDPALVREAGGAQDLHVRSIARSGSSGASRWTTSLSEPPSQVLHRDVVGAVPLAAVVDRDDVAGAAGRRRSTPRGGSARRTPRPRRSARCRSLSATWRPSWRSSAQYTSAMPPEPMRLTSR